MTKASSICREAENIRQGEAETSWKFWDVRPCCKLETLREAYALAKRNDGAPGMTG